MRTRVNSLLICSIVLCCFEGTLRANAAPRVILIETLVLGHEITSISLDTMGVLEPLLLVETRSSGPMSYQCITVGINPLHVIDTFYQTEHGSNVMESGDFDGDGTSDYLVGLRRRYGDSASITALVSINGRDMSDVDTSLYTRPIATIAIDDSSHAVWVGFVNDTTFWTVGGCFGGWTTAKWSGSIVKYEGLGLDSIPIDEDRAGIDIQMLDANNDGVNEPVIFWMDKWLVESDVCSGPSPDPYWRWAGMSTWHVGDTSLTEHLWIAHGGGHFSTEIVRMDAYRPFPVADVNGDGYLDAIVSYTTNSIPTTNPYSRIAAYSLLDGQIIWEFPVAILSGHNSPPAFLWELDGDSLLDVLWVLQNPPWPIQGFSGKTGDSLFVLDTDFRFFQGWVGSGDFDGDGLREGIIRNGDTIFTFRLDLTPSSIGDEGGVTPEAFEIHSNYPNPFNASTRISYTLFQHSTVSLTVYDALGRHVSSLVNTALPAGTHSTVWHGTDAKGQAVGSGVYFYLLDVGGNVGAEKMLLLK